MAATGDDLEFAWLHRYQSRRVTLGHGLGVVSPIAGAQRQQTAVRPHTVRAGSCGLHAVLLRPVGRKFRQCSHAAKKRAAGPCRIARDAIVDPGSSAQSGGYRRSDLADGQSQRMIEENRLDPSVRVSRRLERGFCGSKPGVPSQKPERPGCRSAEPDAKSVAALDRPEVTPLRGQRLCPNRIEARHCHGSPGRIGQPDLCGFILGAGCLQVAGVDRDYFDRQR